jgi:hypothetical protein
MQRLQAFQYEPSGDQQRDMRRFAGDCRFVFNKALALQKENHAAANRGVSLLRQKTQDNDRAENPLAKGGRSAATQIVISNLLASDSSDGLKLQIKDAGVSEQPTTLAATLYRKQTILNAAALLHPRE